MCPGMEVIKIVTLMYTMLFIFQLELTLLSSLCRFTLFIIQNFQVNAQRIVKHYLNVYATSQT